MEIKRPPVEEPELAAAMRAKIPANRIVNFMTVQALKNWVADVRDRGRER